MHPGGAPCQAGAEIVHVGLAVRGSGGQQAFFVVGTTPVATAWMDLLVLLITIVSETSR